MNLCIIIKLFSWSIFSHVDWFWYVSYDILEMCMYIIYLKMFIIWSWWEHTDENPISFIVQEAFPPKIQLYSIVFFAGPLEMIIPWKCFHFLIILGTTSVNSARSTKTRSCTDQLLLLRTITNQGNDVIWLPLLQQNPIYHQTNVFVMKITANENDINDILQTIQ